MHAGSEIRAGLPRPDDDSARHSAAVARHLAGLIASAGGSISFAEFMHEALYAPALGYYAAGAQKLGPDGDFVTAPELSPLFGHVLARQVAGVLGQLGGGDILEPGAGSGALAVSVLGKLAELDALPDRYLILEVSADLRARQELRLRRELPQLVERVRWLAEIPTRFSGVVVANEVADAIPVERFRIVDGEIQQARVQSTGSRFEWAYAPAPAFLASAVRRIEADIGRPLENGYESEISTALASWVSDLAQAVTRGMLLLVDYGVTRREYYATDRSAGWLRCHFRHHAHNDPLILPGIQDITSWVDFTAVAEAAASAGMEVCAFTTQAGLMLHGGLQQELADLARLPIEQQVELSRQVKLLTLPAEMGENFKCIALRRGEIDTPHGLQGLDRAHSL